MGKPMKSKKETGGQAYPVPGYIKENGHQKEPSTTIREGFGGMTLRDYFAGQAIGSMIAETYEDDSPQLAMQTMKNAAWDAYNIADEMLAMRNKEQV